MFLEKSQQNIIHLQNSQQKIPINSQQKETGWWFQICFIFTPIWGRFPILTHIFQMGWNHQLENLPNNVFGETKPPGPAGTKAALSPSSKLSWRRRGGPWSDLWRLASFGGGFFLFGFNFFEQTNKPNQPKQTNKTDQAKPNQNKPNQNKPNKPNGSFQKIMVPPNHPFFNRVFHYKPSILGYSYFWKQTNKPNQPNKQTNKQTKPNQTKPKQNKTKQNKPKQNKTVQTTHRYTLLGTNSFCPEKIGRLLDKRKEILKKNLYFLRGYRNSGGFSIYFLCFDS